MKLIKYTFFILLFTSVGFGQNVKITDFDLPVSTAKKFLLNGFYNWSQTEPVDSSIRNTSSWNINSAYTQFYSSPSYAWNLAVDAALFQLSRSDTTRYSYNLAADMSKYFSNSQGWFVNGELTSSYSRQSEFGRTDTLTNSVGGDSLVSIPGTENRPTITVFGGFGYGRRVNATSVAKAIRIDEDLKKGAITNRFMPKSTMLAIAQIIDKESEYRDKYKALYESKIIEDISQEVLNSGVTNFNTMSALGFMRIRDVLYGTNQFLNERAWGGDIRVGISGQLLTRNSKLDLPSANLDIRGRYAYPIGLRHQFNVFATAQTPLDSNMFSLFLGNGGISYSFNMTNRISFLASYNFTVQQIFNSTNNYTTYPTGVVGIDKSYVNNIVTGGFNFYIENYITLNLAAGFNNLWQNEQTYFTNASIAFIIF